MKPMPSMNLMNELM